MKNKAYAALLAGSTFWCLSIFAAPVAGLSAVYAFFSMICHQDPARSWSLAGEPLPVCIRCTSIYVGFLASLWLGFPAKTRWLRLAVVLMLAEFVIARVIVDAALLRSLSGAFAGISAAPFVRQGIEELRESM